MIDYQVYSDNGLNSGMTLLAASVGVVSTWSTSGTISASALIDGGYYQFSVVAVNSIGPGSES